jgi:hypothetical protein
MRGRKGVAEKINGKGDMIIARPERFYQLTYCTAAKAAATR